MTGSLLLTFGDSCLNTQIYSIIAELFRESSAEACAFYKLIKAVAIATSFYSCSHIGLHVQAAILSTMALVGVFFFFVADNDIPLATNEIKTVPQDIETKGDNENLPDDVLNPLVPKGPKQQFATTYQFLHGRPIVVNIGSPTRGISAFTDAACKPQ
ncbi:DUF895 domain membrane protein [Homalodisca vitripennis]|nr:DUF895 domain membrane protein [Homalodisca vitripennis]